MVKRWIDIFDLKNQALFVGGKDLCGPVTNTLEEMASTSNWGVDGSLMGGIILKFARIGHWPLHPSKSNTASPYKLHSSTQLILFTFISSTQSLSQISNCFVLSTEKGKTYQPKRASIPCDNGQHCWETCNYTIQFHALSHLQSWMAGRQNFPRDSWTCSCVCPPPPLPPPCLANRYKSTEQMSHSSLGYIWYRIG